MLWGDHSSNYVSATVFVGGLSYKHKTIVILLTRQIITKFVPCKTVKNVNRTFEQNACILMFLNIMKLFIESHVTE